MGMQLRVVTSSFISGELDERLLGRNDIKQFYQCARRLRNVQVNSQGGWRRRPGLEFLTELDRVTEWPRAITFRFSASQRYAIFLVEDSAGTGTMAVIMKRGTIVAVQALPYTPDQLRETSWLQSLDTVILFHPDVQTKRLKRMGSDASWALDNLPYTNIPSYPFERVTASGLTPAARTGDNILFTSGAAEFSAGDVGKIIRGNAGIAKIIAFNTTTTVHADIYTDFFDAKAIAAGNWTVEEDSWSNTRGWPSCGCFYQDRLYVAGSRQRPSAVWGSVVSEFFNFDTLKTLDDNALDVVANSDTVSAIQAIRPGRFLSVFTADGEWYFPQSATDPLTPKNARMKETTKEGTAASEDVPDTSSTDGDLKRLQVVEVQGGMIFVSQGGSAVREFLFAFEQDDYASQNISILSAHLLGDPVFMFSKKAQRKGQADYVYIVNDDGSMVSLCTLRDQSVTAYTLLTTEGSFKCGCADGDTEYFVVTRTIDGVERQFIERFNRDLYYDCGLVATTGFPDDVVTGFDHLAGETIGVRVDDAAHPQVTVAVDGSITLEGDAANQVQAGIEFPTYEVEEADGSVSTFQTPHVRVMPVTADLPDGTSVGRLKRITETAIQVYEAQAIQVNDQVIEFRQFDVDTLDQPTRRFRGTCVVRGLRGYALDAAVDITQPVAGPMEISAVVQKISI